LKFPLSPLHSTRGPYFQCCWKFSSI